MGIYMFMHRACMISLVVCLAVLSHRLKQVEAAFSEDLTSAVDANVDTHAPVEAENRIYDGKALDQKEFERKFPFMVTIVGHDGHYKDVCGGALIARRSIITAAHCVLKPSVWFEKKEMIGRKLDVIPYVAQFKTAKHLSNATRLEVEKVWYHEYFTFSSSVYDVAVLRLKNDVHLPKGWSENDKSTAPYPFIKIYDGTFEIENVNAMVVGWGGVAGGYESSYVHYATDVRLMTNTNCTYLAGDGYLKWSEFSPDGKPVEIGFESGMGCARGKIPDKLNNLLITEGYNVDHISKDAWKGYHTACGADAGTPLIINNTLVGITSYGPDGCQSFSPTFYTMMDTVRGFVYKVAGLSAGNSATLLPMLEPELDDIKKNLKLLDESDWEAIKEKLSK